MRPPRPDLSVPRVSAPRLQRRYEARRRRRSAAPGPALAAVAAGGAGLAAAAILLGGRVPNADVGAAIAGLRTHAFAIAVAAALFGGLLAQNARRVAERAFATSWLASAPLDPREIAAAIRALAIRRSAPALAAAAMLALASLFAGGVSFVGFCAGAATGVALGWLAGRRERAADPAPPRLARARAGTAPRASLDALARWPFAHALAAADPRLHARLIGAALLTMPPDVPLRIAVAGLTAAIAAGCAFAVLRALVAVTAEAAAWLRSAPLAPAPFARALGGRAFAAVAAAAGIVGLATRGLGGSAAAAATVAATLVAGAATVFGSALARRAAPAAQLRLELAALAALLAAAAGIAPVLPFAMLPAIWAWQWRRAFAA